MKIINKNDIRRCLIGYAGRDDTASDLLYLALSGPLQQDFRGLQEITQLEELPNETLQKRFMARSDPWYRFEVTPEQKEDITTIASWIMDFVTKVNGHYDGYLKMRAHQTMRDIQSIEEAVKLSRSPLMNEAEFHEAYHGRLISEEEANGDVEFRAELSNRRYLYEIMSRKGMNISGSKANNCLKKSDSPDLHMPHKERVHYPDLWRYFSVRTPEHASVITIMIDLHHKQIEYERNDYKNLTPEEEQYLTDSMEYFDREFPRLATNTYKVGYFGTFEP